MDRLTNTVAISQPSDFNRARGPGDLLAVQVPNLEGGGSEICSPEAGPVVLQPGIACAAGLAVLLNWSQFEIAKTRQGSSGEEEQGVGQIHNKTRTSHTVETD